MPRAFHFYRARSSSSDSAMLFAAIRFFTVRKDIRESERAREAQ